ncbi:MAG: hypothetical protein ABIP39_13910 [Polyangiaceae bacterium]
MGKLDDIRKQREAQFAQQEKEAGLPARTIVAKSPPVALHPPPVANADNVVGHPAKRSSEVVDGKCSECGKVKAVQGGLVVSHQKGLGKMCPGSRKEPD